MIRGLALFLSLGLCLLTGTPLLSQTTSGPCATEHAKWSNAYESLQASMENCRQIKYRVGKSTNCQGHGDPRERGIDSQDRSGGTQGTGRKVG